MLRHTFAFLAVSSLAITPVAIQAARPGPAAPLSIARAGADTTGGSELRSGDWFPAALFATIVILGILMATGVIFDDDDPDSP